MLLNSKRNSIGFATYACGAQAHTMVFGHLLTKRNGCLHSQQNSGWLYPYKTTRCLDPAQHTQCGAESGCVVVAVAVVAQNIVYLPCCKNVWRRSVCTAQLVARIKDTNASPKLIKHSRVSCLLFFSIYFLFFFLSLVGHRKYWMFCVRTIAMCSSY